MPKALLVFALLILGSDAVAGPEGLVSRPSRYSVPQTAAGALDAMVDKAPE